MQSSNPVLTRLGETASRERVGGGYGYGPVSERMMSLDDVVVRTIGLLALTAISAAVSWNVLTGVTAAVASFGSVLAGLVLCLVITFARVTNPLVIGAYAVVEGVFLGVVSRTFEARFGGIVVQAVVGTLGVFAGMAMLYKMRVLRATPRFNRFVIGALIGVVVLSLVNWVVYMFGGNLGLIDYNVEGPRRFLPIIFSLVCIAVGALTFIIDFDQIERGVRYGMPEKYAWYCAFGLLVGLIYLYWQILRLLGYMRR
ncbi:Bax inhibitor-1/YccA family protein [Planosporangium thailandense]|uniref:Bax inhibitor-1/YccA family protein n=1 Tax=Planosporangium thailandense TaxID=765197 RepID=A0ABX0XW48_9ACTN|nr:Bax inhibitor-1/YccA family protein [Planosporangium thailandense]